MKVLKVFIIGGSGILGSSLIETAPLNVELVATSTSTYSFQKKKHVAAFHVWNAGKEDLDSIVQKVSPDIIIYAAAITDIDLCEKNPSLAKAVHVEGVKECSQYCNKSGAYFVYLSTSYVFDGSKGNYSEEDNPQPISVYAFTKLEGEKATGVIEKSAIFRVNHVHFQRAGKLLWPFTHFVEHKPITVFSDMYSSSLYANDLAKLIWQAVTKKDKLFGIYHFGSLDPYSRKAYVTMLLKMLKKYIPNDLAIKESSLALKNRPNNSSLNISKLLKLGFTLPSSRETLSHLSQDFKKFIEDMKLNKR